MTREFQIHAGPPPRTPTPKDIRRELAQEAFEAAREVLLERWADLVQVVDLPDAMQQTQETSWALVQTAMLFQWNGEARQ